MISSSLNCHKVKSKLVKYIKLHGKKSKARLIFYVLKQPENPLCTSVFFKICPIWLNLAINIIATSFYG